MKNTRGGGLFTLLVHFTGINSDFKLQIIDVL